MKCKEAQFCNIYIYLSVHVFKQNVAILISSDSKLHQVLSNVLKICSLIAYTSSMHEGVIESYTIYTGRDDYENTIFSSR